MFSYFGKTPGLRRPLCARWHATRTSSFSFLISNEGRVIKTCDVIASVVAHPVTRRSKKRKQGVRGRQPSKAREMIKTCEYERHLKFDEGGSIMTHFPMPRLERHSFRNRTETYKKRSVSRLWSGAKSRAWCGGARSFTRISRLDAPSVLKHVPQVGFGLWPFARGDIHHNREERKSPCRQDRRCCA